MFSLALKAEGTLTLVLVCSLKLQFQLFVTCWCDGSSIIKKQMSCLSACFNDVSANGLKHSKASKGARTSDDRIHYIQ